MTTVAAPSRRARPSSRSTSKRATTRRPAGTATRAPAKAKARAAARPLAIGRLGAVLAIVTVIALVTAVVFHVVLAQNQMELDRLNVQITKEQRVYEQRRLATAVLASPERVITEAEKLGLVLPLEPAQYLQVPGAPMPKTDDGSTSETIADWSKTKPSLGPRQP